MAILKLEIVYDDHEYYHLNSEAVIRLDNHQAQALYDLWQLRTDKHNPAWVFLKLGQLKLDEAKTLLL